MSELLVEIEECVGNLKEQGIDSMPLDDNKSDMMISSPEAKRRTS